MVILVRRKLKDLCLILLMFSLCVCASVYPIHVQVLTEGITYHMDGMTLWPGHLGYGIPTWVPWNFWAMSLASRCPIFEGHKAWTLKMRSMFLSSLHICSALSQWRSETEKQTAAQGSIPTANFFQKTSCLIVSLPSSCCMQPVGRCSHENTP